MTVMMYIYSLIFSSNFVRCAFVKLPSMKDSKKVIAEMKGFPYKKKEIEIRFTAAADFESYEIQCKF